MKSVENKEVGVSILTKYFKIPDKTLKSVTFQFMFRMISLVILFMYEVFIIKANVDFSFGKIDLVDTLNFPQQLPNLILVAFVIFFILNKEDFQMFGNLSQITMARFYSFFSLNVITTAVFLLYNQYMIFNSVLVSANPTVFVIIWFLLAISLLVFLFLSFFKIGDLINALKKFKMSIFISLFLSLIFFSIYDFFYKFWVILSFLVSKGVILVLSIFYSPELSYVGGIPNIKLLDFGASVSAPCSGIEGISLFILLFSIFVIYHRRTVNKEKVLFLYIVGIASVILLNILRIALLFWIGGVFSPALATGIFHSNLGWIMYSVYFVIFEIFLFDWVQE